MGPGIRFLSTLPARGATPRQLHRRGCAGISIHAPREGSDARASKQPSSGPNFYPRSPRGERLLPARTPIRLVIFLSTLPARGATHVVISALAADQDFYPRSPRGERLGISLTPRGEHYFYPRSPRGERRRQTSAAVQLRRISIHAPREGSDRYAK